MPKFEHDAHRPVHVHFGAGAIGLGLVVPVFAQMSRMIIVSRETGGRLGQALRGESGKRIRLIVEEVRRGSVVQLEGHSLRVVRGTDPASHVYLGASYEGHVLLLADDPYPLLPILPLAKSLSISVREPGVQQDIYAKLLGLPWGSEPPPLYAFENSPAMVSDARLLPTELVIDRICLPPEVKLHELHVRTEEKWEVVAPRPLERPLSDWRVVSLPNEFKFFRKRKLYLVNAVHTVLALLGFEYVASAGLGPEQWGAQFVRILIDAMRGSLYEEALRTFARMQALRLVLETEDEVKRSLFNGATDEEIFRGLERYAVSVQQRMTSVPDAVERVFGMDGKGAWRDLLIASHNKDDKHVAPFRQFVAEHKGEIDGFGAIAPPLWNDGAALSKKLGSCVNSLAQSGFLTEFATLGRS